MFQKRFLPMPGLAGSSAPPAASGVPWAWTDWLTALQGIAIAAASMKRLKTVSVAGRASAALNGAPHQASLGAAAAMQFRQFLRAIDGRPARYSSILAFDLAS